MNQRRDDDGRLLTVLGRIRAVSTALAADESVELRLRSFAAACLGQPVELCAVDMFDASTTARRVACELAPALGSPSPTLQRHADAMRPRSTEAQWASDVVGREALLGAEVAAEFTQLGLVSVGMLPLRVGSEVLGSVLFASREAASLDEPVEREFLSDLVHRAGVSLHCEALSNDARTAVRMRDEFLSIVSHELRTPLSTILGWSKLLREGGLTAERSTKALDVIHRSALAQSQIIDELLDASRVLGGQLSLSVSNASVSAVVREVVASLATNAAQKRLTVEVTADDPNAARVDVARLHQLVRHLLSNAIKFTPSGGHVQVSVSTHEDHVVLCVADTGVGIEPSFLPEMFDRFRQADGAATRRHGGMGLGLAIVRRIVEAHGGTVAAESPGTGKGATFRVTLPRQIDAEVTLSRSRAAIRVEPHGGPDELRGARVLVVDDERDACELASTVLTLHGARVTVAGSASEALTALGEAPFDLLLSDIGMPNEDGVSLVKKALAAHPSLRTVAFSAFSQPADIARAASAGFQRYLVKPLAPAALVHALAELLHASDRT